MDSVEHRVEMHLVASARRAAGRPVWDYEILLGDIWRNEELSFEQQRDQLVERIKASAWFRRNTTGPLPEILDELAFAEDQEEFNYVWDALYDLADSERTWIDTVSVPGK